jgi:hypothetical protein
MHDLQLTVTPCMTLLYYSKDDIYVYKLTTHITYIYYYSVRIRPADSAAAGAEHSIHAVQVICSRQELILFAYMLIIAIY